ncbi:MAG: aminoglycoside phosphotransferase family protein, partial [Ginsengibacter sp.]
MPLNEILDGFGLSNYAITPFGNGLINNTWLVQTNAERFILQQINKNIFNSPPDIAFNIRLVSDYLLHHHPGYLFTIPLKNKEKNDLVKTDEEYFRLFSFVKHSHTIDVVQTPHQAYEAAKQFGRFTNLLSALNPSQLKITLPNFHNISFRYRQFEDALQNGNRERINRSKEIIEFIKEQKNIVQTFDEIKSNAGNKIRITHHDTKISNVLFDENDKGLCVIDLDTVMPGYFISDVGDMMRTYLSPAGEEEKDLSKIEIRKDFYKAIVDGYLSEMEDKLSKTEKNYFLYAGKFMIYMQALRFITDYINNDIYYG